MLIRALSALVLAPAAILTVIYATPLLFLLVLGVIGTLCLREFFEIVRRLGAAAQPAVGYAAFWFLLFAWGRQWLPPVAAAAVAILAAFLAAMWRPVPMRERVLGLMATLLGMSYLALCLFPALPIRFDFGEQVGLHWLMILFAVIWSGDVAALLVGRKLGRTRFAPELSPKKTYEGAVGGLGAGCAAAVLLQQLLLKDLPLLHVIVVSLLIGALGQLGDLAESMLKRAAEVKDSSTLIPGHGGVLDRIDSLLFATPVLYVYLLELYG
jgi:phosphatidate cytidylyltransferase